MLAPEQVDCWVLHAMTCSAERSVRTPDFKAWDDSNPSTAAIAQEALHLPWFLCEETAPQEDQSKLTSSGLHLRALLELPN